MKVLYKTIPGHPDYKISNTGVVISYKKDKNGYQMKPKVHNKGYLKVALDGINYFIHRLVLKTFIGDPPPGKPQTRHLDGTKTNNCLINLRWGSQRDNEDDKLYALSHASQRCYS